MIEDVYEPLARYRDEFRGRFAELARNEFRELVRRSGVNVSANRKVVAQVERLSKRSSSLSSWKTLWGVLMALFFGATVAFVVAAYRSHPDGPWAVYAVSALFSSAVGVLFVPLYCGLVRELSGLARAISEHKRVAWSQMESLNGLYAWDIAPRLIEATVPRLEFDPYFTAARLRQLRDEYGWTEDFVGDCTHSILFSQSGTINGNPFVFAECVMQDWKTVTYVGTKTISWTETEYDAKGNLRRVPHFDVLSASVDRPKPIYNTRTILIYGNDAAPNLVFSRHPSKLSKDDEGFLSSLRMKREIGRLKAFARNLDDEYPFTMMSNHEFEALFHATDRNDEVEFRLLFTALAQTQMLQLLRDKTVGYGDDFSFHKNGKVNLVFSKHWLGGTISTDPERLRDWNYDRAAHAFLEFHERYFKDVYFAFAPLLSIPLYQQTRPQKTLRKGVVGDRASFWEDEATANYLGEEHFKAAGSDTYSILKAVPTYSEDGQREVAVTAYGFRARARVEHVSVFGGDGRFHDVPVEWIEYVPVSQTRTMVVTERKKPSEAFVQCANASRRRCVRRSISAYVR